MFGGKFIHCVLISIVILLLSLLGAEWFARTALLALCLIALAYGSFLFTVFVRPPGDIRIPVDNTFAYMVRKNESDPTSDLVVNFNQTQNAKYTSFRLFVNCENKMFMPFFSVTTFTENLMSNFTRDYTTGQKTDFALMFAIIFSGVTG